MKVYMGAALCAALCTPASLLAQAAPSLTAPIVAVERPTLSNIGASLPSNTEIWLSPNSEINSKKIKQGEKFAMSVTRDVMLGDFIVIPRGTSAWGQISYRTGKGAFGKSAKMEFDIVDVEFKNRQIPVKGHYRIEGQGNTGATVGAVVAVGVLAVFVTGRSAVVSQGSEYRAYTTEALPVVVANSAPAPVAMAH